VTERDRFGRLLAYAWLIQPADDNEADVRMKMFNAELLLKGYAQVMTSAPNVKYADMFVKFEREARNAGRGLWAATVGGDISGIVITSVDLRAEIVTIKNQSSKNINISNCELVSIRGNQRFMFPANTVIPAKAVIAVVSGPTATTGTGRLLWARSHIWNNDGDPAVLLDVDGREIARKE
jgi:hypothetical protein